MNKKIISFSLWGEDAMYTSGAIKNAALCTEVYPGWICRFYMDDTVPKDIVDKLYLLNCEIVYRARSVDFLALFWRFEPLFDNDVSHFIVRDSDARLDCREKKAVDEWLESGKTVHIMRDHPNHKWEIMGGMWGASKNLINKVPSISSDFNRYFNNPRSQALFKNKEYFSYDQIFLKECLWPYVINDHVAHDEFNKFTGNELSFTISRNSKYHFVGQKYTQDDVPVFSI